MKLRQSGVPLPAALGIFAGAGDATHGGGDSFATYGTFGWSRPLISDCPSWTDVTGYIGKTDPRDPVLSPMFANLTGFPPTLFLTSTRDFSLSATTILHRAFRKAGVQAELIVFEGLAHAFWSNSNLFTLPETVEANHLIAAFFDRQLGRSSRRAHRIPIRHKCH